MRSYHRQTRKTARRWLRWLSAGRVQADDLIVTWALWAIAAVMALSALLQPATANAYPMACRNIPHGQICRSSIDGMRTMRCDRGYMNMPDWTCKRITRSTER